MPCESMQKPGQTVASRKAEVEVARARLEASLQSGRVAVGISPQGAVVFKSWNAVERDGVTDVCAYRTLTGKNSWPLRQAIARAEMASGRKVNAQAVAAGLHSHDGGKSWGTH